MQAWDRNVSFAMKRKMSKVKESFGEGLRFLVGIAFRMDKMNMELSFVNAAVMFFC